MDNSLEALMCPKSVAVVGASRSRESIGGEIFANLVRRPFAGPAYPINPNATDVQGVRAYPNVAALPARVDLAIVAVPATAAVSVVEQCADAGVQAVVMITAGFREAGGPGALAEQRMLTIARERSMRIVGPNCLGVLNTDPAVALHGTFATDWPPGGKVSVASQSGAIGIALLDEARDHGIGIRQFVSLGNEMDVSAEDLLEYWEYDNGTQVILLYLESFPTPRRFLEVARRVTRNKPVIVVKSGRTPAGARAAGSHTGSLTTKDVLVDALLTQAGVVRVSTLEELFDAAAFLSSDHGGVPGRRVAVVTNAGGPGILTADACEARGLAIPVLNKRTVDALECVAPGGAAHNPLDLLAGASAAVFDVAIPIVLADRGIDALIVECVPTTSTDVRDFARVVVRAREHAQKPIVTCIMGKHGVSEAQQILRAAHVPTYSLPEAAASALRAGVSHAERCRTERDTSPTAAYSAPLRTFEKVGTSADRWLKPEEVANLFDAFGLQVVPSLQVEDAAEAVRAADSLGWPVALKVVSKSVLHKSDVGGVILGLSTAASVRDAVATLHRRMEAAGHAQDIDGFLVQPMAPSGIEMFIGATRDPGFGPAIAFGTGGVELELWNDVIVRLAPLSHSDAVSMVNAVRGHKLLDGFRGRPRGDRQAVANAIVRASHLMEVVPDVLDLDINPLLVLEPGRGAAAVDARVRVRCPVAGA
jgi:acetate---CoA ligase (ADP-forming)